MRIGRWILMMAVVAVILLSGFTVAGRESVAQTAGGNTPAARAAQKQRLDARKLAFERAELRRFEILDRLEFIPRPPFPPRPIPPGPLPPGPLPPGPLPPGIPRPFPKLCLLPPATLRAAIDPHRSLFVHDRATLDASGPGFMADFSLKRTLTQLATQASALVPGTTAVSMFRQFWDTQNLSALSPGNPHCSDPGAINNFPIMCPRVEGQEALGTDAQIDARMGEYKVLALVNRLDLAHEGWRNCGEHRIVYGKRPSTGGKNLMIFEAVLPNPRPGCREACVPVAEFWKSLSSINDPVSRAQKLETFFYTGLPGFRPVVHVNHYSANGVSTGYGSSGSGQIRTNQFLQAPWMLREYKTVIDCGTSPCKFFFAPTMVKVNPQGTLWNPTNLDPRGLDFRADTLLQKDHLAAGSLMDIGYAVDLDNDAGQSVSQGGPTLIDNYREQMDAGSPSSFETDLATAVLTADQMANRAIAQSCAGCHMPGTFQINLPLSIGSVTTPDFSAVPTTSSWPNAATPGFVHVDTMPASVQTELAANPAAFGSGMGQEISRALLDFFLPARKNFLLTQLNLPRCLCLPRFTFLDLAHRRVALEVQGRIDRQFEQRFLQIDKRLVEMQGMPLAEKELAGLVRDRADLVADRDKVLSAELGLKGITLPDAEALDLKPQAMKLRVTAVPGNPAREWAQRMDQVMRALKQEPPRRTVTGSFQVH